MTDLSIPIDLFTIVFGTLLFGMGYIGLRVRYFLWGKEFYALPILDKIIQSFLIGVICFFVLTEPFFIGISNISDEASLLSYVIAHPSIFLYQLFFVLIFIYFWVTLEALGKLINKKSSSKSKGRIKH